jgi:hypothetical protein
MEEKKSYSIKSFIRRSPDISIQVGFLRKAIINEDLKAITRNTIFILSEHRDLAKIFRYSEKLLREERPKFRPDDFISVSYISSEIRNDWMEYKVINNIRSDEILDNAVIDSVINIIVQGK